MRFRSVCFRLVASLPGASPVSAGGFRSRTLAGPLPVSSDHQAFLHDLLGVLRIHILRILRESSDRRVLSSAATLPGGEVVFGGQRAAFDHGIGDLAGEQADGAQRVVVAGNHPIDFVGIAVGVDDGDHGMPSGGLP
jgi:hypothetical protein